MNGAPMTLDGAKVLVLEDDYYLATDLQSALEAVGAIVVGPFADEADAARSLVADRPDCAFVDVNLGRGPSYDVARELVRLAVPFVFVTGYDAGNISTEFHAIEKLEKPIDARRVAAIASRLVGGEPATSN